MPPVKSHPQNLLIIIIAFEAASDVIDTLVRLFLGLLLCGTAGRILQRINDVAFTGIAFEKHAVIGDYLASGMSLEVENEA